MRPLKFEAARVHADGARALIGSSTRGKIMKRTLIAIAGMILLSIGTASAAPSLTITNLPAVSVTAYGLDRQEFALQTTILSVDPVKNTITIRGPEGQEETVEVGAEARKLGNLKPGDQMDTRYLRAVALQILPADSDKPSVDYSTSTTSNDDSGISVVDSHYTETVTTALSAIDMARDTVTLTGADGHKRIIDVRQLDKRDDFAKLKVGDLVRVTYMEALAISLDTNSAR
jgi:hypothetical protein